MFELAGEKTSVDKVVPVPLKDTVCGLLVALSVTDRVAERAPETVGANEILILQVPPAATLEPQSLDWLKLVGLAPVSPMLLIVSGTL